MVRPLMAQPPWYWLSEPLAMDFANTIHRRGMVDHDHLRTGADDGDGVGGPDAVRFCDAPSCGGFFAPERANQRWCDDSCGTRARVARHAAAHRGRGG